MGYTHYFKPTRQVTDNEFNKFISVCRKLYKNLPEKTNSAGGYYKDEILHIASCDGYGKPKFTKDFLGFNGAGDKHSHESFIIEKNKDSQSNFCKTARKPYDLLVVACLIAAWQIIDYKFDSDGFIDYNGEKHCNDLQAGIDFYNEVIKPQTPITQKMLEEQSKAF